MQRPTLYTQIAECTHILMHNVEAKYMYMHLCDVVYGTSSAMAPIRVSLLCHQLDQKHQNDSMSSRTNNISHFQTLWCDFKVNICLT